MLLKDLEPAQRVEFLKMSETNPFYAKTTLHCFVQDQSITKDAIESVLDGLSEVQKKEVLKIVDLDSATQYETAKAARLSQEIKDLLNPDEV